MTDAPGPRLASATDAAQQSAAVRALEARVVRKLRWRILPFVILLYFVSFLDRVNVGFAAFTMNKAIGLTPAQFGFGGGIFFLGYVLFQVPSNLMMYRVGARAWISWVVVVWGVVSAASAFVTGPHSFYAMRFLLGIAESGFFPGTLLYLSLWFPARHKAVAISAFMAAGPLSTAIGSPLSGALMELPPMLGLANWQWLFILEGAPAILLGFLALKLLTDSPSHARWLTPPECVWLTCRLREEREQAESQHRGRSVLSVMRDPRVLVLSVVYTGTSAGVYALGLWAPLIIRQFGFSPLMVGWLNALPNAIAVVGMVLWARSSDRTLERVWHVVIPCALASAGFVWAGWTGSALGVVLALALVSFGSNASKPPLWAVPSVFLSGPAAAAGIAWINSLGNIGGFAGPYMIGWARSRWGSYTAGLDLIAVLLAISSVLMLALSGRLRRDAAAANAARS
jgi:ACS family tartrate transporter-like MFS transporter